MEESKDIKLQKIEKVNRNKELILEKLKINAKT
jgi:hypothetical protein